MIRKLIILLSVLCFGVLYAQNQKYIWEEIDFPPNKVVRILGGSSENNFMVFDNHGSFFRYKSGSWKTIFIPQKENYIYYVLQYLEKGRCLIIAMDEQWYAHFFILNDETISKFSLIHNNPFNYFRFIDEENIYAAGAFGSLAKFDGNSFTIIKTPIISHIDVFFAQGKNKYWLGTKSDGIFLFDGIDFKKYECEDGKNHEVRAFEPNASNLRVTTINNETLELAGSVFRHKENEQTKKIIKQPAGFLRVIDGSNNQKSFDIPLNLKPFSVNRLTNGTILFSSQEGKIFKSKITLTNYFNDLSPYFNLNRFITNKVECLSISDISNDGFPDLFISQQGTPTEICFGNKSNFFSQQILQSDSLIYKYGGYIHAFGDVDGDNINDLVTAQYDGKKSTIEIFKGTGNDFVHFKTIHIDDKQNDRLIESLTLADLDKDGDLDLIAVYYLGKGSSPGSLVFIENRFWGSFWRSHNYDVNQFTGWNKQVISADFNNDGLNDLYVVNRWGLNKLFINHNGGFVNKTRSAFIDTTKTISNSSAAFDYDNDGDLDLLVSSDSPLLQLYENDGFAKFKDVSSKILFPGIEPKYLLSSDSDLIIGDFNNDGFLDLFVLLKSANSTQQYFFINNEGKYFSDKKSVFALDAYSLSGAVTGDIDDDGDLDIISYDNSNLRLLINNLDNKNFLKIKLLGSYSTTPALGTKIYVYKAGHINDKRFLIGYRQTGSYESSKNQHSDLTAHFGLPDSGRYDVIAEFYIGKTVILQNVSAGQTLSINEVGSFYASLINLPGILFRFFSSRDIQFYIISILLSLTVLLFGIKQGVRKLSWDMRFISILSATNISAFWIILIVTSDSLYFLFKYVLPFFVMLIGTIIPLYVSFLIKHTSNKNSAALNEELLQLCINFSHGQWALTNLNGLILLMENLPAFSEENEKIVIQLNKRFETFTKLTYLNFLRILELAKEIPGLINKEELTEINSIDQQYWKEFDLSVQQMFSNKAVIIKNLYSIKKISALIRTKIISEFSSLPEEVINSIINSLSDEFERNGIQISKTKSYSDKKYVLISRNDLAEIIGNCIQNSVRALTKGEKKIEILLDRITPKIKISIIDNGEGISTDKWENIFESGYSEKKSSGIGLFQSRELLKKYGGRIYVSESIPYSSTIITIELNEGIKNEADIITN